MASSRSVAVAMSGGVDSTVAALLLKRAGWHVMGVFMMNWDELDERGQCSAEADYREVERICSHIAIPCRRVDFVREYWNEVFSELLEGYRCGRTPNPDVLCNERIKFDLFHRHVQETYRVGMVATGHYARLQRSDGGVRLFQSVDKFKDQTYFLATVPQNSLQRTLFPVGDLTKIEVKHTATMAGLPGVARRKESKGLCFIGKRRFTEFLTQYLEHQEGDFEGQHLYTIGQRARLDGRSRPWFVVGKDCSSNTVTVAEGEDHPALYCHSIIATTPSWVRGQAPDILLEQEMSCFLRYRHQQNLIPCQVAMKSSGQLHITSSTPLRAVAPGQYAVLYAGEECMGGASIDSVGPTLWQQYTDRMTEHTHTHTHTHTHFVE